MCLEVQNIPPFIKIFFNAYYMVSTISGSSIQKDRVFLSLIVPLFKTIFRIIMIVKILIFQISNKGTEAFMSNVIL